MLASGCRCAGRASHLPSSRACHSCRHAPGPALIPVPDASDNKITDWVSGGGEGGGREDGRVRNTGGGQERLGGRKEGREGERRPGGAGLPAVTSGLSAITFINPSGSHYLAATSGPCRPCPATALRTCPALHPFPSPSFLVVALHPDEE